MVAKKKSFELIVHILVFYFGFLPFGFSASDILFRIDHLYQRVSLEPNFSTSDCLNEVSLLTEYLDQLRSKDIDLDEFSEKRIDEIVKKSFATRQIIKAFLASLDGRSIVDGMCLDKVKILFLSLRYVEDYLIELRYQGQSTPEMIYTGEGLYFLTNEQYGFRGLQDLKSGDVLLSRGRAFTSAAIATIGSVDSQFSHLSLVSRMEEAKPEDASAGLWTTEAHIEFGSENAPFSVYLNEKHARNVLFRSVHPELAPLAADFIFNLVGQRQSEKAPILYDFKMLLNDREQLFCSEIVEYAYQEASQRQYNRELLFPKFPTRFKAGNLDFLNRVGLDLNEEKIKNFTTFAPGDIQFDPHFDLVAEWRNPAKLRDSRYKDAILFMLFDWMEKLEYKFHPTGNMKVKAKAVVSMRGSALGRKIFKLISGKDLSRELSPHMTARQVELILVLDKIGPKLFSILKDADNGSVPLLPSELHQVLEAYRVEDLKNWKLKNVLDEEAESIDKSDLAIKAPFLHVYFRPRRN